MARMGPLKGSSGVLASSPMRGGGKVVVGVSRMSWSCHHESTLWECCSRDLTAASIASGVISLPRWAICQVGGSTSASSKSRPSRSRIISKSAATPYDQITPKAAMDSSLTSSRYTSSTEWPRDSSSWAVLRAAVSHSG